MKKTMFENEPVANRQEMLKDIIEK